MCEGHLTFDFDKINVLLFCFIGLMVVSSTVPNDKNEYTRRFYKNFPLFLHHVGSTCGLQLLAGLSQFSWGYREGSVFS